MDLTRLKLLWILAALGGIACGLAAGAFALAQDGLDAGWLVAAVLALGLGVYVRAVLLTGLVRLFAPKLLSYFNDTDISRAGDSVEVRPDWRLSGDPALDQYLASFSGAYAITLRSLVWALIIATVIAIVWVASLFGLVDFSW